MKTIDNYNMELIRGGNEVDDAFIAGLTCGAAIFMPSVNGFARLFGRAIPILSCINYITSH